MMRKLFDWKCETSKSVKNKINKNKSLLGRYSSFLEATEDRMPLIINFGTQHLLSQGKSQFVFALRFKCYAKSRNTWPFWGPLRESYSPPPPPPPLVKRRESSPGRSVNTVSCPKHYTPLSQELILLCLKIEWWADYSAGRLIHQMR